MFIDSDRYYRAPVLSKKLSKQTSAYLVLLQLLFLRFPLLALVRLPVDLDGLIPIAAIEAKSKASFGSLLSGLLRSEEEGQHAGERRAGVRGEGGVAQTDHAVS